MRGTIHKNNTEKQYRIKIREKIQEKIREKIQGKIQDEDWITGRRNKVWI